MIARTIRGAGRPFRERGDSNVSEPKSGAAVRPGGRCHRSGIFLLAAAICASFVLAPAAHAQTKISIGYSPFIDALSAFVGKDKGIFAKHGLDAELVPVPLNSNMPAAILSGSVNLGAMSTTVFLQAVDAGLKLQIAQNISMLPNKDAVIAFAIRNDVAFEGAKSLEGKRVSVPGIGSSAEVLFQIWVSRNGGDPKKITAVEMASAQAGDALRAKQTDGAVVVEPFLTRIVQGGIGKVGFRLTDGLPGPVTAISYVGERSWIEKNGKTIAAARAAFLEATEWVRANPADARGLITTYLKLPKEVVDILPLPLFQDKIAEDDLRFWIDAMKAQDRLRSPIDPSQLILP
jgi:NitT/TauT family transport system substrate-binding protein